MTGMPKQSAARKRLAQHLEDRRVELDMTWADVADGAGVSTETLRQIRSGSSAIRPLTGGAIERALGWQRGSIRRVLEGGEPTLLDGGTEISGAAVMHLPAAPGVVSEDDQSATAEAIRHDPRLMESARTHLLAQYQMLAQLSDLVGSSKSSTDAELPTSAERRPQRPERAVARKRPSPRRGKP